MSVPYRLFIGRLCLPCAKFVGYACILWLQVVVRVHDACFTSGMWSPLLLTEICQAAKQL